MKLSSISRAGLLISAQLLVGSVALAQKQQSPWTPMSTREPAVQQSPLISRLSQFTAYTLNVKKLREQLANAPIDRNGNYVGIPIEIELPTTRGRVEKFYAVEQPILSPELEAQNPEIKTYYVQGIDQPSRHGRIDFTLLGFHGMIRGGDTASIFIDPASLTDTTHYTVYSRDHLAPKEGNWTCYVTEFDRNFTDEWTGGYSGGGRGLLATGTDLRTHRLALHATGEYANFFGSTDATGPAAAQAAMVTSINRVTGVYEVDFSIRLNMTHNHAFTNGTTDPFTNGNPSSLLSQSQSQCDGHVLTANYDVGHVFSTAGGGLAALGVVGTAGVKAQGETGTNSPVGDAYDIDYVAHELGHQYGMNHSFNGTVSNCGGGNRNAATAWEPGSGSTIMGYAGICGSDDLQAHSDALFHTGSYDECIVIRNRNVGTLTSTGNTIPVVTGPGNFTIPANTPFMLQGSATDANGDTLTYIWEQKDAGSPLFRDWTAVPANYRIFPKMSTVLAGLLTATFETLPAAARTMNFRMTARDNRAGGGGSDFKASVVTVAGTQFIINTGNSATTWPAGSTQTISWTVGGGSIAPNVKLDYSTTGGSNLDVGGNAWVASLPNSGTATVQIPWVSTNQFRFKLSGIGNIFFDINNTNIIIDEANQITNAISPNSVRGGVGSTGTITLTNPAPAGGLPFTMSSNNAAAIVPGTVTVPAGTSTVNYPITTNSVVSNQVCTITAARDGINKTAQITVTPNTAPVANGDSYSTPYVTTLNVAAAGVLGNDTDANGDALTAVLVAGPTNGSLTLNANGSFSYTPNSGFSGNDTFTYKASDGALQSNTATVTITVGAQPKLVGNITLNDFNPGPNGIAIDVEIRDHTTQVVEFTLSGTLDASGNYSINLVPPVLTGNHDVAIKASHWLRKNVANVSFSGVTATANATLTNGDVDNDNVVSIFDYVRMSLSFDLSVGDAGFDPAADLDGDGTVSIFDYIILSTHFDEQGD